MKLKSRFLVYGLHILFWMVVLLIVGLVPNDYRPATIAAWCALFGGTFLLLIWWHNHSSG